MRISGHADWSLMFQRIVEERIRQAQSEGLFDDLPGKGRPLALDDDSMIASELRASYRILRNAGILPPEMQLRREISGLRQLLEEVQEEEEAVDLVREINGKIIESNLIGRFSINAGVDQIYAEKSLERIRSRKSRCLLEDKMGGEGHSRKSSRAGIKTR